MRTIALFTACLAAALLATAAATVSPTVSRPVSQAAGEKPESLDAIFARKIAHTEASPFYKWLHTPHNQRFLPKPWRPAAGEFLIDGEWSVRAAGKLDDPGPFALEEIRSFFRDGVAHGAGKESGV